MLLPQEVSLVLKPAGQGECDLLASLYQSCFPDIWSPAVFRSFFDQGTVVALVAYEDDTVAGFFFGWVITEQCDLLALAVLPELRHRGIARQLLRAGMAEAKAQGAEKIFLEVGVHNEAAFQLYTSSGYTMLGRRKDYYRRPDGTTEDAVTMEYNLIIQ
jgi:[ribosomal protein S18]-alanine N-acetyltransferase